MKHLTVKQLRDVLNSLPATRNEEVVATYDLTTGERWVASSVDTDCFDDTVVDINFNAE